jgi:hypothetical protein
MNKNAKTAVNTDFVVRPLDGSTWSFFEAIAERHNGMGFGGCWCVWFHLHPDPPERKVLGNREFKKKLVVAGYSHAALVFDGDEVVAWAQFGSVAELPNIHHRKQ